MIVTGGSRGILVAIARLAGCRGYDVCVNYTKSKDQAEQVVRDIEASGQRALVGPFHALVRHRSERPIDYHPCFVRAYAKQ
jgi:NAD(P)-dependent dehydrogenase (short-subunit alcohol dehydrogenase family)